MEKYELRLQDEEAKHKGIETTTFDAESLLDLFKKVDWWMSSNGVYYDWMKSLKLVKPAQKLHIGELRLKNKSVFTVYLTGEDGNPVAIGEYNTRDFAQNRMLEISRITGYWCGSTVLMAREVV